MMAEELAEDRPLEEVESPRPTIESIADRISIPTLPQVVMRINGMLEDPDVGMKQIGAVLVQDAPLVAKVLRIANSSFYGLREKILSAEHAVTVLGSKAVRNIALQASVLQQYEHLTGQPEADLAGIWKHLLLTAKLSDILAKECRQWLELSPDEYYTCGLLHDIGRLVLVDCMGEEYLKVVRDAARRGRPMHLVEEEQIGFDHTQVGALVARRWELPEEVAACIKYHHGPRQVIDSRPSVAVVAVADQLAYRVAGGKRENALKMGSIACKLLGLSPADHARIVEEAFETFASMDE